MPRIDDAPERGAGTRLRDATVQARGRTAHPALRCPAPGSHPSTHRLEPAPPCAGHFVANPRQVANLAAVCFESGADFGTFAMGSASIMGRINQRTSDSGHWLQPTRIQIKRIVGAAVWRACCRTEKCDASSTPIKRRLRVGWRRSRTGDQIANGAHRTRAIQVTARVRFEHRTLLSP